MNEQIKRALWLLALIVFVLVGWTIWDWIFDTFLS